MNICIRNIRPINSLNCEVRLFKHQHLEVIIMPADSPELIDLQSEKKSTPDPEVPGLKKRKPLAEDEESAAKDNNDQNPLVELMNTLQARVERIHNSVSKASGLSAATEFVEGLVDRAFSSIDSGNIKQSAEQTKSQPALFNLTPMPDTVSTDSLLDTLDFNQANSSGKEKKSDSVQLESENYFTYS